MESLFPRALGNDDVQRFKNDDFNDLSSFESFESFELESGNANRFRAKTKCLKRLRESAITCF